MMTVSGGRDARFQAGGSLVIQRSGTLHHAEVSPGLVCLQSSRPPILAHWVGVTIALCHLLLNDEKRLGKRNTRAPSLLGNDDVRARESSGLGLAAIAVPTSGVGRASTRWLPTAG